MDSVLSSQFSSMGNVRQSALSSITNKKKAWGYIKLRIILCNSVYGPNGMEMKVGDGIKMVYGIYNNIMCGQNKERYIGVLLTGGILQLKLRIRLHIHFRDDLDEVSICF